LSRQPFLRAARAALLFRLWTGIFTVCCTASAHAQQVGNTSYTTLPFVSSIYRPCWECTVNLDPAQLFYAANPNSAFLNTKLMAEARARSAQQNAAGIVPTAGLQRWEDTYEASFPAGTFPNEPSWIVADRNAGKFPSLPEFVAWRNFITDHPQYADVAFDGGTMPPQPGYFRSWGGEWGYISPLTPLDSADCPPTMTGGCSWGDEFGYRWAQTSAVTGGYGLQLSDFTDGQPYQNTLHDLNPRIVAAFGKTMAGGSVPGRTVSAQANWIMHNAFNAWTDFLDQGYAHFYASFATQVAAAAQHPALVIDQCSISPSFRRTEGIDERMIATTLSPDTYMCIWDDQVIQIGRSGPLASPPISELAGYVLAAAREPLMRNGANLEADDAAYWAAIASFYPGLTAATQQELGIKLLKRLWVWSAWAHIADRAGAVRRAIAFASRDYWDAGSITQLGAAARLIHSIVPAHPFGPALYYSTAVERATEAANAASVPAGGVPNTYLLPPDLQALLDGGAPVGYYVSDAALPQISAKAGNVPSAWIVLNAGTFLPPGELTSLQAIAPVVTSPAGLAALPNQSLSLPAGLAGFGFWSQTGALIIVVSNPSPAGNAASMSGDVHFAWPSGAAVRVTELQSGTTVKVRAVDGLVSLPVTVSRWDTLIFQISAG